MVVAKETKTIIKLKVLVIITAKSPALVNVSTNSMTIMVVLCYGIYIYVVKDITAKTNVITIWKHYRKRNF